VNVGQQVVRKQDRLGVLEVGAPGHDGVLMGACLPEKSLLYADDADRNGPHVIAEVHPEERRHLVVSGPSSAQPTPEIGSDPLDQTAFERGMAVLIGWIRHKRPGSNIGTEPVQPGQKVRELTLVQQSRSAECARVRSRRSNVIWRKPPVEVHRPRQPSKRLGRRRIEPPTPQLHRESRSLLVKLPTAAQNDHVAVRRGLLANPGWPA
jgi:hypothetical protein